MRAARLASALALLAVAAAPAAGAAFELRWDHDLSTPSGKLRVSGVRFSVDEYAGELHVIGYGQVRVFNPAGMQIYSFSAEREVGGISGVAGLPTGDLVLLTYLDGKASLRRANYRGEVIGPFELSGVPPAFADLQPSALLQAAGRLFLVDERLMRLLVVTETGAYVAGYDLAELIGEGEKREELGINGCGVDRRGRFLFTIAPLFKALILSPDGTVRSFGRPGGAPGGFNVVAGIGADAEGRIYVTDALKGVVSAWSPELRFLGEFTSVGRDNLVRPGAVVVVGGTVYVSQNGSRGVAGFRVVDDPAQAAAASTPRTASSRPTR